jgi:RING-box protein 1
MSTTSDLPYSMKLTSWNPVGYWSFKTSQEDGCSICRNKFEEPCIECLCSHQKGDLVCNPSQGKCGHVFHKHCIDKWNVKSSICPICVTPYATAVSNLNDNEAWKLQMKKK